MEYRMLNNIFFIESSLILWKK